MLYNCEELTGMKKVWIDPLRRIDPMTYSTIGGHSTTKLFLVPQDIEGRKCFYLTTHSNHLIYGYMDSNIWQRTTDIAKEETRCRNYMDYSFRLAARDLLYAPSHRQSRSTGWNEKYLNGSSMKDRQTILRYRMREGWGVTRPKWRERKYGSTESATSLGGSGGMPLQEFLF